MYACPSIVLSLEEFKLKFIYGPKKSLYIIIQVLNNKIGGLNMHFSSSSYQSSDYRKSNGKSLFENAKTNGSYIQAPLVQKSLSTKPHAWRHVFRAFVEQFPNMEQNKQQYLDLTPQQCTTMKLINIAKISQSSDLQNKLQVKKAFRRHYRVDIKQYLKRKYNKQTYQLPLEAFELVRYVENSKKQENLWSTTYIQVYKPFYLNDNIKRRIQQYYINSSAPDKEIFKSKNLPGLFKQLIKCSVEFGGLDNFIMTTSNVYIEQNFETLQINYTSFTGLTLYKAKSKIGAHQFFQITPYLTQRMLQTGIIGIQQRIRFFLIICLCLVVKKDLVLQFENSVQQEHYFTFEQTKQALKKYQIKKTIQSKYLDSSQYKDRWEKKHIKRTKIKQLIRRGLVLGEQLTWEQIVKSICGVLNEQNSLSDKKKQAQNRGTDTASQTFKPNEQYGKKIQQAFKNLHVQLLKSDPQRQFYVNRGLDSQLLYIPVKYHAQFDYIFDKRAWWQIFNIKDTDNKIDKKQYNILHESFCFRLLNAIINLYKSAQKTPELVKKFRQDQTLQIIFTYLSATDFPAILVEGKRDQNVIKNQVIQFKSIQNQYKKFKQAMALV